MSEGVDYSFGRPGGAALAKAGKSFALRYLPYPGNPASKALTIGEIDDLHNHGLSVGATFEITANRALDGRPAGATDGRTALAALKGLGFPDTCPAYFAVDFDPQPQYIARIDAYFEGIGTVLPVSRIGVYGAYSLLVRLRAQSRATWFWQTKAWSGSSLAAFAHLYQYQNSQSINHAAVDFDRSLKSNFGQWDPPGGAGPAQPVEPPMKYNFATIPGPSGRFITGSNPLISYINLETGITTRVPNTTYAIAHPIKLSTPVPGGAGDRQTAYLVGPASQAVAVLATDGVFTPNIPAAPSAISAVIAFSDGSKQTI